MSFVVTNQPASPLSGISLSRYKDILLSGQTAFHARTMEIAELSEETRNLLLPISLKQDQGPTQLKAQIPQDLALESLMNEVQEELDQWNEQDQTFTQADEDIRAITINATQICNLHCTYCAAGGDGTYSSPQKQIDLLKSIPQLQRVLESKKANSSLHIAFLGGEPLLFPKGIRILCEYLTSFAASRQIQLTFKVTTNGTVMNQQILTLLSDYQIGVVISCDGVPEIQDRYRPAKGSVASSTLLEKATGELMAHRQNIPFIGVHCVFHTTEQNLVQAADYFKKLGFDWYEFTPDVSNSSDELTQAYLTSLATLAEREFAEGGIQGLSRIHNFQTIFARLESRTPLRSHCGIGKNFMMMDAKGDFYLCPWMVGKSSAKIQNLKDDSWAKFKQDLVDLHECQDCWARNLCGGGCHFIHNNHGQKKDKSYCERVRGTMALAIRYFGQFQIEQSTLTVMSDIREGNHE